MYISHELSKGKLMVVDIQGSSFDLYDPEIANSDQAVNVNEMLFCAGKFECCCNVKF